MERLLDFFSQSRRTKKEADLIAAAMLREGLIPATNFPPDDVFVTGYPKSGNTWFQILTSIVIHGSDVNRMPFTFVQEIVPDLSARRFYHRYTTPMYYKSHALPSCEYRRVAYLLRDGRDVMVSYKHFREVLDRVDYDFTTFVSPETPLWPCHWAHHVEEWAKNPFGAQMIWIKYEDLVENPVEQLRRFCTFAGVERTDRQLQAAVEATALHTLQKKEATEGNWNPDYKSEKPFFRRGQVGSHLDEMPPEALQRFLDHAAPTLRRFGYAVD